MNYRFTHYGYCPTQQEPESISVTTTEIRMAGTPTPRYRKMSFYCDHANDYGCNISNDCPIYLEAPSDPHFV